MPPKVITTPDKSEGVRQDGHTITVDLNQCISAGPCEIAAKNVFKLRKSDGKAIIADPDGNTMEEIMEAALSCPVLAIFIKNKTGKQIYP